MEMNDILDGLNSCDNNGCDNNNCCCGGMGSNAGLAGAMPYGPGGLANGFGGFGGCGLGSWIWILLILFYCGGCGYNNGGYNNNNNNCCCNSCCNDCCCNDCCCNDCCCNNCCGCGNNSGNNNGGFLGNCSCYLFLLVILFLCNGNNGFFGNGFGLGNCGGCGFGGPGFGGMPYGPGFGGAPMANNGLNCCESNCGC